MTTKIKEKLGEERIIEEAGEGLELLKSPEDLIARLKDMRKAQREFATYSQEEVDKIFKKAAMAANDARIPLSIMAVEETGMGLVEDKVIKNHFAAEHIYNSYKDVKTCGVIENDDDYGFTKIAEPIGVIGAIIPTTNPTSTAINKSLLALKTRNAIIFSPHPRAKKCTIEAARIVLEAAVKAGAPEGIIGWIDIPSIEMSQVLMSEVDLILATGGPGMVKAAYSSGKPAIGVGPGNTPAIIDETADIRMAVNSIVLSKTFDNGVICASEQSIIAVEEVYDQVREELIKREAHLLSEDEKHKLRKVIPRGDGVNPEIVGQPAAKIAKLAGIDLAETTKILVGEVTSAAKEEVFSREKLSPILGFYKAKDFDQALDIAEELISHGGMGHTSVLYTDEMKSPDRIDKMASRMKTGRVLINTPSSQGGIGDLFNFKLKPSLTLGCGSWGGNSVSENVNVEHLLNIKSVAKRRDNMLWFKVPEKLYFKHGSLPFALKELAEIGRKRAFIVTDKVLHGLGYTDQILKSLEEHGVECKIFTGVEPDPSLELAERGVLDMIGFQPDIIIGLGGGSAMDAAKIMHVMYEYPEIDFEDLALRFSDIRKRVYGFPKLGKKALMVSIPTSAGTGSEVTPFTIITDGRSGVKYALADYELTPYMAIVDSQLMMNMPRGLTASSGIDALTHALEAYVSTMANPYSDAMALKAIRLIFDYLPRAYRDGGRDVEAREEMANAAALAGMAFANAFLGICHSLAHKMGAFHGVPHGVANALLITEVIRFNAVDDPRKQAAFSQYKYPDAGERYREIADFLGLAGSNRQEKIESLIGAIDSLKKEVGLPFSVGEFGVDKDKYFKSLEKMSYQAFDDQCTGTNPRYPSIEEMKEIYTRVY